MRAFYAAVTYHGKGIDASFFCGIFIISGHSLTLGILIDSGHRENSRHRADYGHHADYGRHGDSERHANSGRHASTEHRY